MRRLDLKDVLLNVRLLTCAFLLFLMSYPKWLWGISAEILTIISLFLLLLSIHDFTFNLRKDISKVILLLIQIIFLFVCYYTSFSGLEELGLILARGLCFASLFFCSAFFWTECVNCFIKLLAVFLFLSIVEHILVSFLYIETITPSIVECPLNRGRDYYSYLFNVYLQENFSVFNRFYAFFDEPGVVGNVMMVLLFIQKFDLKKWYNIIFLVSGILSFSLAFYIATATYFILIGNIKSKISFIILVIIAIYFFYENEFVYKLVFGRLEFDDGQLAGYNRENYSFDIWFKNIDWTDFFLTGYWPRKQIPYAASWKWAFATYGIIPSLIYLSLLVFSRVRNSISGKDILLGLILLVIIWIQRPLIHSFFYVFLLMIPFVYYNSNNYTSVQRKSLND